MYVTSTPLSRKNCTRLRQYLQTHQCRRERNHFPLQAISTVFQCLPLGEKSSASRFDITMGSFDGAETCELVGCYLLSCLTKKYGNSIGRYRDDGLAVVNSNPQQIERIKKGFCQIFRENDLKITVEANTTKVNFLDVTLDLQSGKQYPYTKEGNISLYVHKKSNHPPSILKNIPESINKRSQKFLPAKNHLIKRKIPTKMHSTRAATYII